MSVIEYIENTHGGLIVRKLKLWVTIIFIFTALISAGCAGQTTMQQKTSESNQKEIRIGIVPLPHYAHMWVAKEKGFIDEELAKVGYKLKWQPFNLGPMVNEAFAAGQIDMGVMGDFPVFIGRASGTDYQVVSIASSGPKALAMVVNKKSNITQVSDLKGKKIATTKGAYGQKLLVLLLAKNGLSVNDIQFVNMSMDDLAAALARGDVDAGVMWEPIITKMLEADEIKVIADGTGIYDAYAVLMAARRTIEQDPKAVDAVIRAFERGNEYIKNNPDESVKLLSQNIKIPTAQLTKVISNFNYDDKITDNFVADMKDTEEFMRKNGLIKAQIDVASIIRK